MSTGCQLGSVVVMDWRGGPGDSCWSKYQPHSRDVTRLAFAPWKSVYTYTYMYMYIHVIVAWFLWCMGFVQHEGGTIPCTVKTMRQLTCTDRPYKANHQISFGARMSILYTHCMPSVQLYAVYSYSSIV